MIVNISLCSHWITAYGFAHDVDHWGSLRQGSDYSLCSSNNSPERQVNYIQSNQPFVEGPSKEHFSAAQCNLMLWAASTGPAEELLQTKYLRGLIRDLLLWAVKMFDASDLTMGGRVRSWRKIRRARTKTPRCIVMYCNWRSSFMKSRRWRFRVYLKSVWWLRFTVIGIQQSRPVKASAHRNTLARVWLGKIPCHSLSIFSTTLLESLRIICPHFNICGGGYFVHFKECQSGAFNWVC